MVNRSSHGKGESGDSPRRRKVSKAETYAAVQSELLKILKQQETATVDLIHDRLEIPANARSLIGRAFGGLSTKGVIIKVGFQPTDRVVAHGRDVGVWTLNRGIDQ